MKIAILVLMCFFVGCCCQNKPENLTATLPVNRTDNWNDQSRDELTLVCVEGHSYYYSLVKRDSGRYALFAPKLDDDGKPVKCGVVLESIKANE